MPPNAPVGVVVMGLLAVGVLAGWVYWRRQPRSQLKITDTAITWGSPTKVVTRLERGESGLLRFHQNAMQQTGWFLTLVDDREAGGISMIGFDMREVADACVAHGWRFR